MTNTALPSCVIVISQFERMLHADTRLSFGFAMFKAIHNERNLLVFFSLLHFLHFFITSKGGIFPVLSAGLPSCRYGIFRWNLQNDALPYTVLPVNYSAVAKQ